MNPCEAGRLGGRPSKVALARSATARAVASGSQQTLNFSGKLTLSGTFKGTAELELEPRRANLLGAFDDATDGFADEADGQDELADAADGAGA